MWWQRGRLLQHSPALVGPRSGVHQPSLLHGQVGDDALPSPPPPRLASPLLFSSVVCAVYFSASATHSALLCECAMRVFVSLRVLYLFVCCVGRDGNTDQEYISLFADNQALFQGRTPIQVHTRAPTHASPAHWVVNPHPPSRTVIVQDPLIWTASENGQPYVYLEARGVHPKPCLVFLLLLSLPTPWYLRCTRTSWLPTAVLWPTTSTMAPSSRFALCVSAVGRQHVVLFLIVGEAGHAGVGEGSWRVRVMSSVVCSTSPSPFPSSAPPDTHIRTLHPLVDPMFIMRH